MTELDETDILALLIDGPIFWRGETPAESRLYTMVPTRLGPVLALTQEGAKTLGLTRRTPRGSGLERAALERYIQGIAPLGGWTYIARGPRHVLERGDERLVILYLPAGVRGRGRTVLSEARGDPRPHRRIVLAPRPPRSVLDGEVWLPLEPASLDYIYDQAQLSGQLA